MQSVLILGRQPELGLAELESIYGADKLNPLDDTAAIVDIDPCRLAFDRLGGSLKFCKVLTTVDTTDWPKIEQFLMSVSPAQAANMPPGKMRLGLSSYGLNLTPRQIMSTGAKLKKAIQVSGRSVRFIPNQSPVLNTAQVIHNKLTSPNGWELVFIKNGNQTVVAQTVKVQNIAAYARRDQARPKRDPKVGMLPPKLAQIMINLAVGRLAEETLTSICDIPADQTIPPPDLEQTILDPFCGSGVIAQEARLMGYHVIASDNDPRMVDYTQVNLDWLAQQFKLGPGTTRVELGDAATHRWTKPIDFVASEIYLGPAYSAPPSPSELKRSIETCQRLLEAFLKNIGPQLNQNSCLCLAVPAWRIKSNQFQHLPLIDQIGQLGYNRLKFKQVANQPLLYYRPDQIVARELLILTRK